jgi:hypothetical protein
MGIGITSLFTNLHWQFGTGLVTKTGRYVETSIDTNNPHTHKINSG